jgi:tryptophan-rich sensory protein
VNFCTPTIFIKYKPQLGYNMIEENIMIKLRNILLTTICCILLSIYTIGCVEKDAIKADVNAAVEANIASPQFKSNLQTEVSKEVSKQLSQNSTNNLNTGGWGINVSNLVVDGSTLVIIVPILFIIVICVAIAIVYLYKKNGKLFKLSKMLVNYNEKKLTIADKYAIQKEAVSKGLEGCLRNIVKKETPK